MLKILLLRTVVVILEVWPETRFSPSRRFLNVDCRCNSGFLKRIAYTTMPYKTRLRLLGVARNPANGFPARLLVLQRRVMRKHAQVFFFSYGPFIMGDSHSFVASFKIRPRVTL